MSNGQDDKKFSEFLKAHKQTAPDAPSREPDIIWAKIHLLKSPPGNKLYWQLACLLIIILLSGVYVQVQTTQNLPQEIAGFENTFDLEMDTDELGEVSDLIALTK